MPSIRLNDGTIVLGTVEELSIILKRAGLKVVEPEKMKLNVGDYAKDLNSEAIVQIVEIDEEDLDLYYYAKNINTGDHCWVGFSELDPVSEEVTQWAKIGRKVGEFKVGDIVKGYGRVGANTGKEFIGEVQDLDDGELNPKGNLGVFCLESPYKYISIDVTELIVPVESIVNITIN